MRASVAVESPSGLIDGRIKERGDCTAHFVRSAQTWM